MNTKISFHNRLLTNPLYTRTKVDKWDWKMSTSSLHDVLTQEEIDALLLSGNEANDSPIKGMGKRILPQLDRRFNALIAHILPTLQKLTHSTDISVTLTSCLSSSFPSYIGTLIPPHLLGFFGCQTWQAGGLIAFNASLIYTLVDRSMGGRRGLSPTRFGHRPFTRIEQEITQKLNNVLLDALEDVFNVSVMGQGLQSKPEQVPNADMLIARLSVQLDGKEGLIDLVLPFRAIQQIYLQEQTRPENPHLQRWQQSLANACLDVPIAVDVVAATQEISLKNVLKWKKGDTLPLSFFNDKPVRLVCDNVPLFQGKMNTGTQNLSITLHKRDIRGVDET